MEKNNQAAHLKKEILIRIVKAFESGDFEEQIRLIPFKMRPKGSEVSFRCCIHKERAVLRDRTIAGLGFSIEDNLDELSLSSYAQQSLLRENIQPPHLTILDAACKGCTPSSIYVTDLCQGCVARPCQSSCKFGAIDIINNKSIIDAAKCKNCKMCISACPYNAIVKIKIPCEDSCPVDAIAKNEIGIAKIDFDKCISCGKCVSACPFGAVHEKSQIVDVLKNINSAKKVVAMIAPSIVGQFPGSISQLKSAFLKAGFADVYEVALGADVTILKEAVEFDEKIQDGANFMTTSCCAGYNEFSKKHLPEITSFVSSTKTPLYYTAEIIKREIPDATTVFVSPCVAKRIEGLENKDVDFVINYEELGALFIGKKIDILNCEESSFEKEASRQGRNFGISGGVAQSVKHASNHSEKVMPLCINGLTKDSIKILKKMAKEQKAQDGNLVEVMCCEGGCIAGNATLNNPKNASKKLAEYLECSKDI